MSNSGAAALQAGFVHGGAGQLFCIDHTPHLGNPRGHVLLLPPLAEELNKSRRMTSVAANALASDGWWVRRVDPFGCGDSAGEFAEATVERWIEDTLGILDDWDHRDLPLWLWAVRGGALWARQLLDRRPDANVLLWHPVTSGRQALNQFLRLKVASNLLAARDEGGGANAMRQTLTAGDTHLEVAGYSLTSALARGLDAASWGVPQDYAGRIVWLEVAQAAGGLSPAAALGVDQLRGRGVTVEASVVQGPSFWQTTEIEECAALVDLSRKALSGIALPTTAPVQAPA